MVYDCFGSHKENTNTLSMEYVSCLKVFFVFADFMTKLSEKEFTPCP